MLKVLELIGMHSVVFAFVSVIITIMISLPYGIILMPIYHYFRYKAWNTIDVDSSVITSTMIDNRLRELHPAVFRAKQLFIPFTFSAGLIISLVIYTAFLVSTYG